MHGRPMHANATVTKAWRRPRLRWPWHIVHRGWKTNDPVVVAKCPPVFRDSAFFFFFPRYCNLPTCRNGPFLSWGKFASRCFGRENRKNWTLASDFSPACEYLWSPGVRTVRSKIGHCMGVRLHNLRLLLLLISKFSPGTIISA